MKLWHLIWHKIIHTPLCLKCSNITGWGLIGVSLTIRFVDPDYMLKRKWPQGESAKQQNHSKMDLDQGWTYYLASRLQSCTKRATVHPGSLYQCQLGLWVSQSSGKSSIPQFTVIWVNGYRSFWARTVEITKCVFFTVLWFWQTYTVISSVTQLCLTPCDPMDCSTPGLPVHHQLSEFTQTHVHWVSDAIQSSHPL